MWLKQQIKPVLLLFLFSAGICIPAFLLAGEEESFQVPFGEIEEEESKEDLEKTELLATLAGSNFLNEFSENPTGGLPGEMAPDLKPLASRSDSSRAPPVWK